MPQACVVSLDNVALVEADAVGLLITTLDDDAMMRICTALEVAVGCSPGQR